MQQDAQHKAQIAQYEDELARKRAGSEHELNRERNKELVLLQEQSVRNQEAEKRRVQEQIEAERRATEKYRVCLANSHADLSRFLPWQQVKNCIRAMLFVFCCKRIYCPFSLLPKYVLPIFT